MTACKLARSFVFAAAVSFLVSCNEEIEKPPVGQNENTKPSAPSAGSVRLWDEPAPDVLYLVDQLCEAGGVAEARPGDPLQIGPQDLQAWTIDRRKTAVLFSSPAFDPPLEGVTKVLLKVRPDGARSARITPFVDGDESPNVQRRRRSVTFSLGEGGGHERWLAFDLTEVIHDNWDDLGGDAGVRRIEIMLSGGPVAEAALLEIVVENVGTRYRGALADTVIADAGGALRPSWFVAGGASLRCKVRVPEENAELRFHFAADGPLSGGRILVRSETDEEPPLSRVLSLSEDWAFHTISLAPWAGREVAIEWSATGAGALLIGEPRVLRRARDSSIPSVLVYMIDTLRADFLGSGGRKQASSPHMDELAREGLHFTHAFSTSCWTKPAIPTLMTGIQPTTHRVGERGYSDRLPSSVDLLQQRFRAGGWRSASFVSNPLGTTLSALERGFSAAYPPRFWSEKIGPLGHPSSPNLHDSFLEWIDEEVDMPFFAYVHTLEVHEWQQEQYSRGLEAGRTPYDAAITDQDRHFGDLLAALASRGRLDDLIIVLLSDHGEAFGEHRQEGHGLGLYQTQVHIPLIFWSKPAIPARRIDHVVGLADVAPTLLEWVGLPALREADGKSLARYALESSTEATHSFVPSALLHYVWRPRDPQQFSLVTNDLEKIIRWSTGRTESYDLRSDPHELSKLPSPSPRLEQHLERWLRAEALRAEAFVARHGANSEGIVDQDDIERLRSLGYVE